MSDKTKTPVKEILGTFNLITKEGTHLNDTITPGQLEIAETILYRQAPDGKKKIHVMAHTRYGKSLVIGACVAIRAATKGESWAIVAPTKEQAQIIMDYVIQFSVNDPIITQLLKVNAKQIKEEQLTQRRSRDHITFLKGGEVRTYSATATMGHGSPNLIMDEAGLISDSDEAKAYRMIGDHVDNFVVKIGNPWHNNHFKTAYIDPAYHHINIDVYQGIKEGRVTEEHHESVKDKPHYKVLYLNQFPDDEDRDEYGYMPLFTHSMIENAQTETVEHLGEKITAGDPADSGSNAGVIVTRSNNLAEMTLRVFNMDVLTFSDQLVLKGNDSVRLAMDGQGIGAGGIRRLEDMQEVKRKLVRINSGLPLNKNTNLPEGMRIDDFANYRAYMAWAAAEWLKKGGKLKKNEEWKNLLAFKYRINSRGKIQIVSKEELRKNYHIYDLGVADAFTYTFTPDKPRSVVNMPTDIGGVEPYYPELNM